MTKQDYFNCTLEALQQDLFRIALSCPDENTRNKLHEQNDKLEAYANATFAPVENSAFFDDVQLEWKHAVAKYPEPNKNLAALIEEVGEVARALLENAPREQLYNECVQVATMALRISQESCPYTNQNQDPNP